MSDTNKLTRRKRNASPKEQPSPKRYARSRQKWTWARAIRHNDHKAQGTMAGRRGFGARSREDLNAEADAVFEMLAQLKGTGGRGRGVRRGSIPHHDTGWRPGLPPHQEWDEGMQYPRGFRRHESNQFRPDPDEALDHYYHPGPADQDWRRRDQDDRRLGRPQNRGRPNRPPPNRPRDPVTARQLVETLVHCQNFSISLLSMVEEHNIPPQQVRAVVATHGHMFLLQNDVVMLAPRLKLCVAHSSSQGCESRDTCDSLHMCPKFVFNWCSEKQICVLGHRWLTDHNRAILKRLSLDNVPNTVLRQLLRSGQGQRQPQNQDRNQREAGPLSVCRNYNEANCDQVHCSSLHVCLSFVVGLTMCSRAKCHLNHDLLSPACLHLLKLHKLPVNEAPRDVAMALLQANPSLKDMDVSSSTGKSKIDNRGGQERARTDNGNKVASSSKKSQRAKKNMIPRKEHNVKNSPSDSENSTDSDSDSEESRSSHSKGRNRQDKEGSYVTKKGMSSSTHRQRKKPNESSATETDSDQGSDDSSNRSSQPNKSPQKQRENLEQPKPNNKQALSKQKAPQPPNPLPPVRTLWAHYLHGDVVTPQICYYSVEKTCRDEETGCTRLHSVNHYQWQIRKTEQGSRWINLRTEQVACIERAFCDPASNGVDLPRLDPSKLESSVRGLFLLLGRDIWHADFSTMSLTNSSQSTLLQLRRLCTQPMEGQTIKAATHHWYFQDINKKWVMYGKADTADRKDLVSSLTSADIEKHYLQNPALPLTFKNSKFTYVLDLTAMKQTNQLTQVSRDVRRRPEPHLPENTDDNAKTKTASDLPQHWDAMQPEERSRLVALAPTTDEYKKVVSLLGTSVSTANVIKVERIQNPFMWRALQNKVKELMALYKDMAKVDVRQLFHGTSHNVVPSICAENFDWRLHGTASGQSFGRGTYFGTDARLSYGYCRPGTNGFKYMFVARVAVGSMIAGNSSMARPPINPATSMPYDSTVDNPASPRLVVKYSTQEYYPEYLLTLT